MKEIFLFMATVVVVKIFLPEIFGQVLMIVLQVLTIINGILSGELRLDIPHSGQF